MNNRPPDESPKHVAQNRESAESKLRRSKRNCPVCLSVLTKNAKATKRVSMCRLPSTSISWQAVLSLLGRGDLGEQSSCGVSELWGAWYEEEHYSQLTFRVFGRSVMRTLICHHKRYNWVSWWKLRWQSSRR